MQVMKTPRTVDIDITNRCNLRCRYCYHFSGPGDVGSDLTKEEWLHFFEELNRAAVMDVVLAGGEPLVRNDLPEVIEGIVKNRMRFSILSNATLIDDAFASFLHATKRCNEVQVSIDGASPAVHDSCRGAGAFDKAVTGIRCLQRQQVPVAVRVTIHRHNVSDLANIAYFLLEELGLPSFSTNAASYLGLCRSNMDDVGLSVEDRILAMETLVRLNRDYEDRITANAGPLAETRLWSAMEQARTNKTALSGGGHLTGCGCVMNTIAVRADGVIVPCTMLSHIELGMINRDDFQKIWQSHPEMVRMRQRQLTELRGFDFCRGCEFVEYCTGNCPGLAYTITGNINQPSPDACYRKFLQEGGRLPHPL